MPELPEVETIARQLNEVLSNKVVDKIKVLRDKAFVGDKLRIEGRTVKKVSRRSKSLLVYFSGGECLQTHLKMTGQLIYVPKDGKKRVAGGHPTADWIADLPNKFTRVIFEMVGGDRLFFNDIRAFGWVKQVDLNSLNTVLNSFPPDVVDEGFSVDYFRDVISKKMRNIKVVLLDQSLMGGIGNIYANDALNLARISPLRQAKDLNDKEVEELHKAIKKVINLGIKMGGASAANYVDSRGLAGSYQQSFLTYKREGEPCRNCGGEIIKISLGGRGTYYCGNCQL